MMELSDVGVRFGRHDALRELKLIAQEGAITALLGLNGAGKTTALRVMSGTLPPTTGSCHCWLNAQRLDATSARASIGYLADGAGLYQRLSAEDNLIFFGRLYGMTARQARQRAHTLAEQLEFRDLLSRKTEGFSLGERVKVLLGRSLMHSPRHVLLDEPTNGLDVKAMRNLREHLRWLRSPEGGGHCIILSSHSMHEIAALADSVLIMAAGQVIAQGSVSQICQQAQCLDLEDAFIRLSDSKASESR